MTAAASSVETSGSKANKFPFLDLGTQYQTIRGEVEAAIQRVMESQHFILGPEVEALEKELAAYTASRYAVGCASGSDALLLALMALQVGPGDEVITTPFTFVATVGAIVRLGAKPVFVDINLATYNIDANRLESAITHSTKAIIPVHLFGMAAEMGRILEVAAGHGIPVIEDAAQAIGGKYEGRPVGSLGLCGCFSFFPSKNLGGAGDGGMITTSNSAFTEKLRVLRTHGSSSKYEYDEVGINSRLDALQAAILRVKLRHLDSWAKGRQGNAARYLMLFKDRKLERAIVLPEGRANCDHVYNQFVIRAQKRDELKVYLKRAGVPTEIYYPKPLHMQAAFRYLGYEAGDLPQSERASEEALALPVFPEMSQDQQQIVVDGIDSFYRN